MRGMQIVGSHRAAAKQSKPEASASVTRKGLSVTGLVEWRTLASTAFQTATGERAPVEAMVDSRKA